VVIELVNSQGTFNSGFLNNHKVCSDVGLGVDAMVTVNDSFDSDKTCNSIANALPPSFPGTVWFQVVNNWSIWKKPMNQRLDYLVDLTERCKQRGIKVGVYSSADSWDGVMGSVNVGSVKLTPFPLWYSNDNQNDNFKDFEYARFGRWSKPVMKEYKRNVLFCSNYVEGWNYYEDNQI